MECTTRYIDWCLIILNSSFRFHYWGIMLYNQLTLDCCLLTKCREQQQRNTPSLNTDFSRSEAEIVCGPDGFNVIATQIRFSQAVLDMTTLLSSSQDGSQLFTDIIYIHVLLSRVVIWCMPINRQYKNNYNMGRLPLCLGHTELRRRAMGDIVDL